jgi:hypothetical protein
MLALFRTTADQMLATAPAARITPGPRQAVLAEAAIDLLSGPITGKGFIYPKSTDALMYAAAAATFRDIDVVSDAVTVTGQHGIGIVTVESPQLGKSLPLDGTSLVELIFDPVTYHLMTELPSTGSASGWPADPGGARTERAHNQAVADLTRGSARRGRPPVTRPGPLARPAGRQPAGQDWLY